MIKMFAKFCDCQFHSVSKNLSIYINYSILYQIYKKMDGAELWEYSL